MRKAFAFLFLWALAWDGEAQTVEILAADQISRDPNITEAQRLIGHVKLGHQDAVLTCDSAWRFDDGKVEVFGDVVMRQPPATTMNARYVVIQPGEDWARAEGEVVMVHEGARLEAPSLSYLMKARRARYRQGANIQDDGWTVTSRSGTYWAPEEVLELGGDVLAVRDADTLRSDSLHWRRAEERYVFHGPTTWTSPEVGFSCRRGVVRMEERDPTGWLAGEVDVQDEDGTISGDSLKWSDDVSEVWGEVVMRSADGTGEVHGAYARRDAADSLEVVVGSRARRAWLRQIEDGDTLHLAARELTRHRDVLTATREVTMVQEEMVGVGDSLVWDEGTQTIRVWGSPELWSAKDRMAGDSLTLFMRDQSPEKLELRGHAVVLAPANDTLAHRIQGRDLDAHFVDGELVTVDVVGNGEVVTFEVTEEGRAGKVRMNTAVCAKVTLEVADRKLTGISLKQSPRGTIKPVPKGEDLRAFQVGEAPSLGPWETSQQDPLPE
jgi:hypothetical protein